MQFRGFGERLDRRANLNREYRTTNLCVIR
jgi:hypothetical protein